MIIENLYYLEIFAFVLLVTFFIRRERFRLQKVKLVFGDDYQHIISQIEWSYRRIKANYTTTNKDSNGNITGYSFDEEFKNIGLLDVNKLKSFCCELSQNKQNPYLEKIKAQLERYKEVSLQKEEYDRQLSSVGYLIKYQSSDNLLSFGITPEPLERIIPELVELNKILVQRNYLVFGSYNHKLGPMASKSWLGTYVWELVDHFGIRLKDQKTYKEKRGVFLKYYGVNEDPDTSTFKERRGVRPKHTDVMKEIQSLLDEI